MSKNTCPDFNLEIEEINPDPDKVRILTCSDDPRTHSGFGGVHRHIIHSLRSVDEFQVASVAWYPPKDSRTETKKNAGDGLQIPNRTDWAIIPCSPFMTDYCGKQTTAKVIHVFQPHVVITIGDPWNLDALVKAREVRSDFVWVAYVPIDGLPLDSQWAKVLDRADHIVAYGSWGNQIIKEALPNRRKENLHIINHGTDPEIFYPLGKDKEELKSEIGISDAPFLAGWIARNTARKRLDLALEAFGRFVAASITCPTCRYTRFQNFDPEIPENVIIDENTKVRCQVCDTECIPVARKDDAHIYLHFGSDEPAGFNRDSLIREFKLQGVVKYPSDIRVGMGVAATGLNKIYNSLDVMFNTAEAEGWGMPIHEAMACRIPVIVPNFGGYLDDLVIGSQVSKNGEDKINAFIVENKGLIRDKESNYHRAYPDPKGFAFFLDYLYHWKKDTMDIFFDRWQISEDNYWRHFYDNNQLGYMLEKAYLKAVSLNWSDIGDQWIELVNKVAPPLQQKEVIKEIKNWNQDKDLVLGVADVSDQYDINAFGPEISFSQVLQSLGSEDINTVLTGYAKGNEGFVETQILDPRIKVEHFKAVGTQYQLGAAAPYVEELKPQVIISHGLSLIEASQLAAKHQVPLVSFVYQWNGACGNQLRMATCHLNCSSCSAFMNAKHLSYYDPYMKALAQSSLIGFPSEYMQTLFLKQWGSFIDPKKTFVLYPEVNKEDPMFINNVEPISKHKYIMLMRGAEEKGSLIFALLAKLMPEENFLMFAPSDQATVEAMKGVPNIQVMDKTDCPSMFYSMAKLVLIPSIWREPFSRVSIEATLHDVPVLVSDIEGLAATVCPAARIDRYNVKAWKETIETVLTRPPFAKKIINDNKNLVNKYYRELEEQKSKFAESIRKIINDSRCSV